MEKKKASAASPSRSYVKKPKSPAWDHFQFDPLTKKYVCLFCNQHYRKHATAWEEHLLLKCTHVSPVQRETFKKRFNKGKKSKRSKLFEKLLRQNRTDNSDIESDHEATVECEASTSSSLSTKRGERGPSKFVCTEATEEKEQLDTLLCEMLCVLGLPFNVVDHPLFVSFVKKLKPSYLLPSRYELSNKLLEKTFKKTEEKVTKSVATAKVLTLMFDGSSSLRNDSVMNFVLGTPLPVFYSSIWTDEKTHTGNSLFIWVSEIIESVGPAQVLSVCTYSASNIEVAKNLLEQKYPWISVYPCMNHILNNLMRDIFKIESLAYCINTCKNIFVLIEESHILMDKLSQFQKRMYGKTQAICIHEDTKFDSYKIIFESLLQNKQALRELALDESPHALPITYTKALLDPMFWCNIEKCVELLEPLCKWILLLEGSEAKIGEVVETFHEISENTDKTLEMTMLPDDEKELIRGCVSSQRNLAITNLHFAANMLHPRFKGSKLSNNEFKSAEKFIIHLSSNLDGFSSGDSAQIINDLANFLSSSGLFCDSDLYNSVYNITPLSFWRRLVGRSKLAVIAERVLQLHATSSPCERTFSTFGTAQTLKRNKSTSQRIGKISYVKHNWNFFNREKLEKFETAEQCDNNIEDEDEEDVSQKNSDGKEQEPALCHQLQQQGGPEPEQIMILVDSFL